MYRLLLPGLGETMQRGTILRWLKREGESYEVGDVLYEVESEKATAGVDAKRPGTLVRVVAREGEELPIGAALAIVADRGESLSEAARAATLDATRSDDPVRQPTPQPAGAPAVPTTGLAAGRIRVMPRARVLAQQYGIDLAAVEATGPNGSITVEDVERAVVAERGGPGCASADRCVASPGRWPRS